MADIDQNRIQLIEIAESTLNGLKVKTVTFRYENRADSVTLSYVFGEREVRDDALVSVARDWIHKTCKDIAHATEDWEMDDAKLKAAAHPLKRA